MVGVSRGALLIAVAALVVGCGHGTEQTGPRLPGPVLTTQPPTTITVPTSIPSSTATTRPATTTTPTTKATPPFAWRSAGLSAQTVALMAGRSWRTGCPVPLSGLRLVDLMYWGFDQTDHWGQLVVNADSVTPVVGAFRMLFDGRFPVRQMRLVDEFGADDEASMAADNTSAFNCRQVPGTSVWSEHAYGRAVDVDPLENPEVRAGQVDPPSALRWVDRTQTAPGMIHYGDSAWVAFRSVGWKWGGDWSSLKDYQHFSANGL